LAYLGLLFAITVLGITLATIGVVWSTEVRRDKEAQLLFAGHQIRAAIGHYFSESGQYPPTLAELLTDSRYPEAHRHLRRLYYEPMTNSQEWTLIYFPGGGIMGVASPSQDKPIKQTNFDPADALFKNAQCYCDWVFEYSPRNRWRVPPVPASTPPQP
jgi:type II secretory pathway pseudopilin PulG